MHKLGPDKRPGFLQIDVIEGYDKWALTYDNDPNPLIAVEEPVTLELTGEVKGQNVLDLGCGTGRYCKLFAGKEAEVTGIDPSFEMIEKAKKKVTASCQFKLLHGTLADAELSFENFDLIVSALTFCHIPDIRPVFEKISKILSRDGRVVISDFHPYWPVFGHGYTEFFDKDGQEYRINNYPHLFEEYFELSRKFGLEISNVREPKITDELVKDFPSLADYLELPLALILKLRRIS